MGKLRNAEVAADLTQETFLRFSEYSRGHPATVIVHHRSYLYRTAHNLAIDHLRRESHEETDPVAADVLDGIRDDRPSAEQTIGGQDELDRLRAALLELPERTRQVFALARIEGLTYRAVAVRLEISDSSVQKHLAKAVKHVMQRMRTP